MKPSNYPKIFKALSNDQRLKIFQMIYEKWVKEKSAAVIPADKGCCAVEKAFTKVCSCFPISRSTVSHHFKELQNAGLISCEREGQSFRCRINEEAIEAIKNFLG